MKKFISTLIMIIVHLFILIMHWYSMKINDINWFQSLSFLIVHSLWQDFYRNYLKNRIYGLK
jgi:hypothetical protein